LLGYWEPLSAVFKWGVTVGGSMRSWLSCGVAEEMVEGKVIAEVVDEMWTYP